MQTTTITPSNPTNWIPRDVEGFDTWTTESYYHEGRGPTIPGPAAYLGPALDVPTVPDVDETGRWGFVTMRRAIPADGGPECVWLSARWCPSAPYCASIEFGALFASREEAMRRLTWV